MADVPMIPLFVKNQWLIPIIDLIIKKNNDSFQDDFFPWFPDLIAGPEPLMSLRDSSEVHLIGSHKNGRNCRKPLTWQDNCWWWDNSTWWKRHSYIFQRKRDAVTTVACEMDLHIWIPDMICTTSHHLIIKSILSRKKEAKKMFKKQLHGHEYCLPSPLKAATAHPEPPMPHLLGWAVGRCTARRDTPGWMCCFLAGPSPSSVHHVLHTFGAGMKMG